MIIILITLILIQFLGYLSLNIGTSLRSSKLSYKSIIGAIKEQRSHIKIPQIMILIIRSFIITITTIVIPLQTPTFFLLFLLVYIIPFISIEESIWEKMKGGKLTIYVILYFIINILLFTMAIGINMLIK